MFLPTLRKNINDFLAYVTEEKKCGIKFDNISVKP